MTRRRAVAIHFLSTIALVSGFAWAVSHYLYPDGLHFVTGLNRLILAMFATSLVSGPLLTLLLFKPGKRGLKMDMTIVLTAQLTFLGYGLNALWESRPAFIVGSKDQFTVVFANEIDDADFAEASSPEFRRLPSLGPKLVGVKIPTEPSARAKVIEEFVGGGAGIERSPKYYLEFQSVAPDLILGSHVANDTKPVTGLGTNTTSASVNPTRWLPIASSRGEGLALIDPMTGKPIRIVKATAPTVRHQFLPSRSNPH